MARTKITISKTTQKKPHRFHAGTVAKRTARKEQMSTKFILPRASFDRLVVQAIQNAHGDTLRKSKAAMELLQHATEDYLCDGTRAVQMLLTINNTKTATAKNVNVMLEIRNEFQDEMKAVRTEPACTATISGKGKRHVTYVDPLYKIPQARLKKIFYKGSVLRISKSAIEEYRCLLSAFVNSIIRDAVSYTVHARKRTVTEDHIKQALVKNGRPIYG